MMLKRILVLVLIGALPFVAVQFASVFFYAWAFEDFVKDEVKFTPMREPAERVHLVEHILTQAQPYRLAVDPGNVAVERHTDRTSGITTLQVNVSYISSVDLYYFTYHLRRNLLAKTTY
jgi:hypothetical protein